MPGVCLYGPSTSLAAVAFRCAWNISAPPPAAGAGPPGLGGVAMRVRELFLFIIYLKLVRLCFILYKSWELCIL